MQFNLYEAVKNGFKFSCQQCGKCCTGKGEGEIFVYKPDLEIIFKHFNCDSITKKREFVQKYLTTTSQSFVLRNPKTGFKKYYNFDTLIFKETGDNEDCCFLEEGNTCSIWDIKPYQCIIYPLWRVLLTNESGWKENSKKCKGVGVNEGKFYSPKEIQEILTKEYELEKNFFLEMKQNNFDITRVFPFLKPLKVKK